MPLLSKSDNRTKNELNFIPEAKIKDYLEYCVDCTTILKTENIQKFAPFCSGYRLAVTPSHQTFYRTITIGEKFIKKYSTKNWGIKPIQYKCNGGFHFVKVESLSVDLESRSNTTWVLRSISFWLRAPVFFKISFSIRSSLFSLRTRFSSSHSSSTNTFPKSLLRPNQHTCSN